MVLNMNYNLIKSTQKDVEKLKQYKKETIFEYADNLSKEEIERIENYINCNVPNEIDNYCNIVIDNKIVGCLLITKEDNGMLLDEIYLEKEYRNKGIGTDIIKQILKENKTIFLWVYKLNEKAISLYKKLGFNIINETETRFYMEYKNIND